MRLTGGTTPDHFRAAKACANELKVTTRLFRHFYQHKLSVQSSLESSSLGGSAPPPATLSESRQDAPPATLKFCKEKGGAAERDNVVGQRPAEDVTWQQNRKEDVDVVVPIQMWVEYRGWTMVAMPFLPLQGRSSLVYGSSDGGHTVFNHIRQVNDLMRRVTRIYNLAPHHVNGVVLSAAGDVEVHVDAHGTIFLLDFARFFPAEDTRAFSELAAVPGDVFCRMLRPEFLLHSHLWLPARLKGVSLPLSSDALSAWERTDSLHHHNAQRAAELLRTLLVPKLAAHLDVLANNAPTESASNAGGNDRARKTRAHQNTERDRTEHMYRREPKKKKSDPPQEILDVTSIPGTCHSWGLSLRHLGLLCGHVRTAGARHALWLQMAQRSLKQLFRSEIRLNEHQLRRTVRYCNKGSVQEQQLIQMIVRDMQGRFGLLLSTPTAKAEVVKYISNHMSLVLKSKWLQQNLHLYGEWLSHSTTQEQPHQQPHQKTVIFFEMLRVRRDMDRISEAFAKTCKSCSFRNTASRQLCEACGKPVVSDLQTVVERCQKLTAYDPEDEDVQQELTLASWLLACQDLQFDATKRLVDLLAALMQQYARMRARADAYIRCPAPSEMAQESLGTPLPTQIAHPRAAPPSRPAKSSSESTKIVTLTNLLDCFPRHRSAHLAHRILGEAGILSSAAMHGHLALARLCCEWASTSLKPSVQSPIRDKHAIKDDQEDDVDEMDTCQPLQPVTRTSQVMLLCPAGHSLIKFRVTPSHMNFRCDVCPRQQFDNLFGCRKCNWDVCDRCHAKIQKEALADQKELDLGDDHAVLDSRTEGKDKEALPSVVFVKTRCRADLLTRLNSSPRIPEQSTGDDEGDAEVEVAMTPLSLAAQYGHRDMVELLLRHMDKTKLRLHHVNANGHSALILAVKNRQTETVRYLLERKAPVDQIMPDGMSALSIAAKSGDGVSLILLACLSCWTCLFVSLCV